MLLVKFEFSTNDRKDIVLSTQYFNVRRVNSHENATNVI